MVPPVAFEDRTGFESMFDGKSLTPGATARAAARAAAAAKQAEEAKAAAAAGQPAPTGRGRGGLGGGPQPSLFQDWDGDPKFWRVENGVMVGESTPEKVVGPNTFLIWKGGTPGDFELKVEIKMNSTNSGIQYRSKMLPPNEGQPDGSPGTPGGWAAIRWTWTSPTSIRASSTRRRPRFPGRARHDHLHRAGRHQGADRQPRDRRELKALVQAGRLESVPPDRPRQHAHPHRQRPRHGHLRGRRPQGPIDGGADRLPAPRRAADEAGNPQRGDQAAVDPRFPNLQLPTPKGETVSNGFPWKLGEVWRVEELTQRAYRAGARPQRGALPERPAVQPRTCE